MPPDEVAKTVGSISEQLPMVGAVLVIVGMFIGLFWKWFRASNETLLAITDKCEKNSTAQCLAHEKLTDRTLDVIDRNTATAGELKAWFESQKS